jgi:hypothetical protein
MRCMIDIITQMEPLLTPMDEEENTDGNNLLSVPLFGVLLAQ